jgi:hypothetical protein
MEIDALWVALMIILNVIGWPSIVYMAYLLGRTGKVLGIISLIENDDGRLQPEP